MIVLDADVLLVDLRYLRDSRFARNRQVLNQLQSEGRPLAATCHTLLEILGVSCFNLAPARLLDLAKKIPGNYGLSILPDPVTDPDYAGATFAEIRDQIATRFSFGDAVTALQIAKFIPEAVCFLSWNARHFRGKLAIPTMTPEEWWQQNQPAP